MEKTLERISKSALKLLNIKSTEEIYEGIITEALKLVDAQYGSLLLEDDGEYKRAYGSSKRMFKFKTRTNGFVHKVFQTNKPVTILKAELEKAHPEISSSKVRYIAAIPLSYQKKVEAVMTLYGVNKFSTKDVNVL